MEPNDFQMDGSWGEVIRILRAIMIQVNKLEDRFIHSDNFSTNMWEFNDSVRPMITAAASIALGNYEPPPTREVDPAQRELPIEGIE